MIVSVFFLSWFKHSFTLSLYTYTKQDLSRRHNEAHLPEHDGHAEHERDGGGREPGAGIGAGRAQAEEEQGEGRGWEIIERFVTLNWFRMKR